MAQLTNEGKQLNKWLESQYDDEQVESVLEEEIQLTPLSALLGPSTGFTPPYTPMAKAASKPQVASDTNKQELDKVLAYAIGKVNKYRMVRSPASLNKLRAAIKELNDVAKENGITPLDEPESEEPILEVEGATEIIPES